jgi:beta-lactamase class A
LIRISLGHRFPARSRLVVLVATALVVSACSDSGRPLTADPSTASSPASAPVTTSAPSTTAPSTSAPTTSAPVDPTALAARLQSTVDSFVAEQPVPFSVVVVDLSTGARAAHFADRKVLSASLYKLFVARELIRRIDAGKLTRDAPAGDTKGRTIGACLEAMIVVSDNPCGAAGLRLVGGGALDSALHRDGFVSTSLASPQQTSAADVALFFQRARDGTLLGPGGEAGSAELYGLLEGQQVNDRLPLGLPPGTPLAHKTGDRLHWAHDAGVMSTGRGDVEIVVLSGPWSSPCCDADHPGAAEAKAFGAIAELGRRVYATVS